MQLLKRLRRDEFFSYPKRKTYLTLCRCYISIDTCYGRRKDAVQHPLLLLQLADLLSS